MLVQPAALAEERRSVSDRPRVLSPASRPVIPASAEEDDKEEDDENGGGRHEQPQGRQESSVPNSTDVVLIRQCLHASCPVDHHARCWYSCAAHAPMEFEGRSRTCTNVRRRSAGHLTARDGLATAQHSASAAKRRISSNSRRSKPAPDLKSVAPNVRGEDLPEGIPVSLLVGRRKTGQLLAGVLFRTARVFPIEP